MPGQIADLPRLEESDFTYLGATRFPAGAANGISAPWDYTVGSNIAYNPNNNSLFAIGNCADNPLASFQPIAELALPADNALNPALSLASLPVMTYVQQPRSLVQFLTVPAVVPTNAWAAQKQRLFGIGFNSVDNSLIIGTYHYYTSVNEVESHTIVNANISTWSAGTVMQLFKLYGTHPWVNSGGTPVTKTLGGACFGQSVAPIPAEWQAELGGKTWLCGGNGTSVVERTGVGPNAFGWNPADVSTISARTVLEYQYQPIDDVRPEWRFSGFPDEANGMADGNPSIIYNAKTEAVGMLPIPGTRTILYTGEHSRGYIYYGQQNANLQGQIFANGVQDDIREGHGYHASTKKAGWRLWGSSSAYDNVGSPSNTGSYRREWWLYDASNWPKVMSGAIKTTDILPYSQFEQVTPIANVQRYGGGAAIDPVGKRIFVLGESDDKVGFSDKPLVHVWRYNIPAASNPTPKSWITLRKSS